MNNTKPPASLLRNIAVTVIIGTVVFWLGRESAERGVFKLERDVPNGQAVIELLAVPEPAAPTPTPLPAHFPTIRGADIESDKNSFLSLADACASCWKLKVNTSEIAPDGEITPLEAEKLFGRIKKREVLEKTAAKVKLGLIFSVEVFPTGAAGSATEIDGRWTELQIRAAGRMLHCESPNRCQCL